MRGLTGVLFVLLAGFLQLSFSQSSSPESVLSRLDNMSNELVSYAKIVQSKGMVPNTSQLSKKIFEMLNNIMTKELSMVYREKIKKGLSDSCSLTETDNFLWALPISRGGETSTRFLSETATEVVVRFQKIETSEYDVCLKQRDVIIFSADIFLSLTPAGWRINNIKEYNQDSLYVVNN